MRRLVWPWTSDEHGAGGLACDRGLGQAVPEVALDAHGHGAGRRRRHQTPLRARRSWESSYGLSVTFSATASWRSCSALCRAGVTRTSVDS